MANMWVCILRSPTNGEMCVPFPFFQEVFGRNPYFNTHPCHCDFQDPGLSYSCSKPPDPRGVQSNIFNTSPWLDASCWSLTGERRPVSMCTMLRLSTLSSTSTHVPSCPSEAAYRGGFGVKPKATFNTGAFHQSFYFFHVVMVLVLG